MNKPFNPYEYENNIANEGTGETATDMNVATKTWKDRFVGDIYLLPNGTTSVKGVCEDKFVVVGKAINPEDIENLISQEIQKAVEERDKEIVEMIEEFGKIERIKL